MKKWMAVAVACGLAACGGGTVTGPDPVTEQPAPVAQATPAPQPVAVAPSPEPGAQHNARVRGGFYSVTNETSVPQLYCAAAFGVLPSGEQSASTNLYEDQGIRQPGDVFSGQAPKTAACQYKQIQVDLTQSKDCRKFDWGNVLAAEVYSNPGYIEDTFTALPAVEENTSAWGQCSPVQAQSTTYTKECPGTRSQTYDEVVYEVSACSKTKREKSRVQKTRTEPCTASCTISCSEKYPTAGAVNASVAKVTTLHPGTPEVPAVTATVRGYNFDNNDTKLRDACEAEGGSWYHDDPHSSREDVCYTNVDHGPSWFVQTGSHSWQGKLGQRFEYTYEVSPKVPAVPDKYSVTVTLSYNIAAGAAQTRTFKIMWNGSTKKKEVTVNVECGEPKQGTLVWGQGDQYNNSPNYSAGDGHVTGNYAAVVQ